MGSNWSSMKLGECADFLSGGTPSNSNLDYWIGTIPWVSAKELKLLRLHDAEDHISQTACADGARLAPSGSILMLVQGMTVHNDLPICVAMREMTFNQDLKALVAKPHVSSSFLTYWLIANKPELCTIIDSASHGTGRIHTDVMRDYEIKLPQLAEQRRIAEVFERLDDKIELNRRTNETLEAMAKALFKSWFVDFDLVRKKAASRQPAGLDAATAKLFPDTFEDSPLGKIPKGWRAVPLPQAIEVNRTISLAKGTIAPYLEMTNTPTTAARAVTWKTASSDRECDFATAIRSSPESRHASKTARQPTSISSQMAKLARVRPSTSSCGASIHFRRRIRISLLEAMFSELMSSRT